MKTDDLKITRVTEKPAEPTKSLEQRVEELEAKVAGLYLLVTDNKTDGGGK